MLGLLAAGAFASAVGVKRRARQGDTPGGTARLEGFDWTQAGTA